LLGLVVHLILKMGTKKEHQIACLRYHLSIAIEERRYAIDNVKGIREEIKKLTSTNPLTSVSKEEKIK